MTTWRMRRPLALALVLSLLVLGTPLASGTSAPELPTPSEVIGGADFARGMPALACVACVAGGVYLAVSPFARLLSAAMKRGSFFALAGCADMCYRAITQ